MSTMLLEPGRRGLDPSETGITNRQRQASQGGCCDLNSGSLSQQLEPLTAESSL